MIIRGSSPRLLSFRTGSGLGRHPLTRSKLMQGYGCTVLRVDGQLTDLDTEGLLPLLLLGALVSPVQGGPILEEIRIVHVSIGQGSNFGGSLGINSGATTLSSYGLLSGILIGRRGWIR